MARELYMSASILHKLPRKRLYAYTAQIVQDLELYDKFESMEFATDILWKMEHDTGYLNRIMFSNKAFFIKDYIFLKLSSHYSYLCKSMFVIL